MSGVRYYGSKQVLVYFSINRKYKSYNYQICYHCCIYFYDYVYKFWQEMDHICRSYIIESNGPKFVDPSMWKSTRGKGVNGQSYHYQIRYRCSICLNEYVYKFWQENDHICRSYTSIRGTFIHVQHKHIGYAS